jgi:para-aminobenzoate synthetase component 1
MATAVPPRAAPAHPWIARHWHTPSGALVAEAAAGVDPATVFARLSGLPHALWLDSALADPPAAIDGPRLGRYSFVTADPIHSIVEPACPEDPAAEAQRFGAAVAAVRGILADLACPTIPGLPPFQGGNAGLLSYECGLAALGVPPPAARPAGVPLLSLHAFDVVFAYDHDLARGWFISQGVPATGPGARRDRATCRLATILAAREPARADSARGMPPLHLGEGRGEGAENRRTSPGTLTRPAAGLSPRERQDRRDAAPDPLPHLLPGHPLVGVSHSAEGYREMVRAGIEFVRAGDIFQANLAQQFSLAAAVDPLALHARARELNAAPFAACFDAGPVHVVSMSPERFLQLTGREVRMHPIKGTRRVIASPEADLYAGADLEASAKDRAENVMIVDLVRNDLARVCEPASVRVESLCRLERYRYVQHLVSIVAGRLRRGLGPVDALLAALPAGSVTGAPKHRACEIIGTLEGRARGAYCGTLGYLGLDGAADFNLLIRTFVVSPAGVSFAAGGGVTAASDPEAERAESLHKAEGMLRVLDALGLARVEPA